ncbi:MAG: chromosomal replication initiator protein DnaA [Methanocorpusculum sp.]|nr:chromosomal replication initiator protein DnaA [Methanocorpusculum sp.]
MTQEYNFSAIWKQVLQSLADEIDASSFDIWFSMVNFETVRHDKVYISVPNSLTKEWIESRYLDNLQNKLRNLTNQEMELIINTETQIEKEGMFTTLNYKYTFDSFVVGNSNRFAHAACYAVGESPSKAYNPLFIYGGVGLGKTHLMQAIGHHIMKNRPTSAVVYISSEQFTNDLIGSIKDDNMASFRNKYRGVDVLLVDDIQFLAGKERTQEEFFHTFNTLYESDKQVVISSDRPPRNIPTLEDRLRSRFEWGLITDIQPPDLETRVAILRKKAQAENFNVPYDILDYIAHYIDSNIRELEGALVSLIAYSTITNKPLNMTTASEALKDILPPPQPKKITIESIQNTVSKYYGIEISELLSKKRNKHVVYPRHIAMYLCRRLTEASLPQIGEQFGGRDHTTVLHANEKITRELEVDREMAAAINELCKKIDPDFVT